MFGNGRPWLSVSRTWPVFLLGDERDAHLALATVITRCHPALVLSRFRGIGPALGAFSDSVPVGVSLHFWFGIPGTQMRAHRCELAQWYPLASMVFAFILNPDWGEGTTDRNAARSQAD